MSNRYSIKLGGESGQGINTLGLLLSKSLKSAGYNIFAYREYPSLIKGGVASYQIDISTTSINSSSKSCNLLAILDPDSIQEYIASLNPGGILIYDDKIEFTEEQKSIIQNKNISTVYLDTQTIAINAGGNPIMANIVMISFIWKLLGLSQQSLEIIVKEVFSEKGDDIVEKNLKCIAAGFNSEIYNEQYSQNNFMPVSNDQNKNNKILTGNDALALGAIACGVRAYYGYPMTPATSIFKYLGNTYKETGILIKQAESEITAVQMVMGSMAMGTRAFTATSGGGFDLMQETISCAGISEVPLVIVLAQRIGAGTGVPTWTGSSDIQTAVKAGHGEFPKAVLSISDIPSAYVLIQQAFNIAERYQIPVIVLTEKQIAESLFSVTSLPEPLDIQRGMGEDGKRYEITENGISPRWIPEDSKPPYLNTSDEHYEDGTSTEISQQILQMSQKRMQKLESLRRELPEPTLYGDINSNTVLVGSGSTKNTVLDAISAGKNIAYLHYEYIYPLKTDLLMSLASQNKKLILVENNQTGELGKIITETCGYLFKEKILKTDGRPFFLEDILNIEI